MRESIGGAFQFNLVVIFLGVYIAVLAFALVYAKAFNTKNHVITLIEQYEGYNNQAEQAIENYMSKHGSSSITFNDCCNIYMKETNAQNSDCQNNVKQQNGLCVFEYSDTASKTHYYVVTTFLHVDVPIISNVNWPISGETKVLYDRS